MPRQARSGGRGATAPILGLLAVLPAASAAAAPPSLDWLRAAYRCDIAERLERIHAGDRTTDRDRFLAVAPAASADAYVQCIFEPGDVALYCEVASGGYRQKPGERRPLAPLGDPARLSALGFVQDSPERNFARELTLGERPDFGHVADLMLTWLHDGLGIRPPAILRIVAPKARKARAVPAACRPVS